MLALNYVSATAAHASGAISLAFFIFDTWYCDAFWWVFAFCSALPFLTEIIVILGVFVFRKQVWRAPSKSCNWLISMYFTLYCSVHKAQMSDAVQCVRAFANSNLYCMVLMYMYMYLYTHLSSRRLLFYVFLLDITLVWSWKRRAVQYRRAQFFSVISFTW